MWIFLNGYNIETLKLKLFSLDFINSTFKLIDFYSY